LGPQRLKLKHDKQFSDFAFYFNLRRYIKEDEIKAKEEAQRRVNAAKEALAKQAVEERSKREAGAYTRPLLTST
jgi:hypothetical protein